MLQVRNVSKVYDGRTVVNDVSFDVAPGEIFALLGPNGAGKTTLIRMITDIVRPDAGTITFAGHSLGGPDRPRLAYLPEERGLYKKVPVLDALAYYGELKDLSAADARREGIELLEEFGLASWAKKQVSALSKGMQQKLQLCTALIGRPLLLILDEPFTGLDPINVQVLEDVLRRRRAEGTTVLLSTHQMNKVEQQCDRALMINRGHMVLYGQVGEIRRQHAENEYQLQADGTPRSVAGIKSLVAENGSWKVALERSAHPAAVLRSLLDQGLAVRAFVPLVPPLEDIFVNVVQQGLGLDHGKSGPPTVDEPLALGGAR
ncbi:MAG TPA: ATP-binding cassette domain-containing protein [Candidatus Eisenbacteria bacterium]|jgi:ABC-2 type transport system ATP-binding protein